MLSGFASFSPSSCPLCLFPLFFFPSSFPPLLFPLFFSPYSSDPTPMPPCFSLTQSRRPFSHTIPQIPVVHHWNLCWMCTGSSCPNIRYLSVESVESVGGGADVCGYVQDPVLIAHTHTHTHTHVYTHTNIHIKYRIKVQTNTNTNTQSPPFARPTPPTPSMFTNNRTYHSTSSPYSVSSLACSPPTKPPPCPLHMTDCSRWGMPVVYNHPCRLVGLGR